REVLPGDGAAPGGRRGVAWRSGGAAAGRTGERAGSRGGPLDPQPAEVAGRAGPHGARVQPPDQRDGTDRRAAGGDPPGAAARGHDRRRAVGRVGVAGGRILPADPRRRRVPGERGEGGNVMTTTAETRVPGGRYGLAQAARMEWIKLRSLRSTWWTLAV